MKFTMANAVKQIMSPQAFEGEDVILAMARKQSKQKSKGGCIITPEMSKVILLHDSVDKYKSSGEMASDTMKVLVGDWERQNSFIQAQDRRILQLERSLRWYKQRHKKKKT